MWKPDLSDYIHAGQLVDLLSAKVEMCGPVDLKNVS